MASQASTLQGSAKELLKHAETHSYWGLPQGIHLNGNFIGKKIAIDNPLELCFSLSLSLSIVFGTAVPYFALCSDKATGCQTSMFFFCITACLDLKVASRLEPLKDYLTRDPNRPWGAGHQHVVRELQLAQEE